jgi:glycerol-3-phosphate acyltransferase PlsX
MATRIAVDAMGGDDAPDAIVEGAIRAAQDAEGAVEILLVGHEDKVHAVLNAHPDAHDLPIRVQHAPDVIHMTDAPASAVKTKRQSSIHRGLAAHEKGEVDAFVSAGNTGAVMAASMFVLGRISGIARPSIVGYFPNLKGASIVLDIGSNVDCKPSHLVQFARMGTVYLRHVHDNDAPSVGLLSIGEEPSKGNEQVKAAHDLLRDADDLHFKGNVEGSDLLFYAADIIICDGFVGNIMLKFGETMTTVLSEMTRQEMERQGLTPDERALVSGVLSEVRKGFDPEGRGGAPLLGVNGTVMVGHGSSSPDAIAQLIHTTVEVSEKDVTRALTSAFAASDA